MGIPADPDRVAAARRLGPLPWSALGRSATPALPGELEAWLGEETDRLWRRMGCPDPFVVVEAGAGDGARAAGVLASAPSCAPALRWLLVDDGPGAADAQRRLLGLESPALVLGPAVAAADPDDAPRPPPGIGPLVASLPDLPSGLDQAVVVAAGWISRLACDRYQWHDGRWWEVRLAAAGAGLEEMLVDAGDRKPPGAPGGGTGERVLVPVEGRRWLAQARRVARSGRVLAVDDLSGAGGEALLGRLGAAPAALRALTGALSPLVCAEWAMAG